MASLRHERKRSPHARRPTRPRHTRFNRGPGCTAAADAGTHARRSLPCGFRRAGQEDKRIDGGVVVASYSNSIRAEETGADEAGASVKWLSTIKVAAGW